MDVTLILPVFNREAYLETTLRSLPLDLPLIVVDNGSADTSYALARRLCDERNAEAADSGIEARAIVVTEPAPGAAAARNRGLQLCATEWVYFFDSDDEFTSLPDCPDAESYDLICFPVTMVVDGQERMRDYRPSASAAVQVLSATLSTQTMLFRTEWLRAIGGWNDDCRIWNDWELGLRALLNSPRLCWLSDAPRHRILVHDDSITGPSYSARAEAIRATLVAAYSDALAFDDKPTLRALDLRCHIVSGRLRREGNPSAAKAVSSLVDEPTRIGRALEWYVAHGGRGAWRLALRAL